MKSSYLFVVILVILLIVPTAVTNIPKNPSNESIFQETDNFGFGAGCATNCGTGTGFSQSDLEWALCGSIITHGTNSFLSIGGTNDANHPGEWILQSNNVANSINGITSPVAGGQGAGQFGETWNWNMTFIIKTSSSMANILIQIGMMQGCVTTDRNNMIFEFDSTEISNWQCITSGALPSTSKDSGVTAATNTWYKFTITRTASNVLFYINGALTCTNTTNLPQNASASFDIQIIPSDAAFHTLTIDYFHAGLTGLTR